jgi:hypothetical protein
MAKRLQKKKAVNEEKFTGEFTGEIIELTSTVRLPKNVGFLERNSLQELLDAFVERTGELPKRVYKFTRQMNSLYYARPEPKEEGISNA